ncbi:hypothetical protein B9J78_05135 [bacterium Unc6]|nr:hypothetical protein [bacterium Unc6]
MEKRTIVKIRQKKEYPEAKNHVVIGEILEETEHYLRLRCKVFHYRTSNYKTAKSVDVGKIKIRWIPWNIITVVTELPSDFNWESAKFKVDGNGKLILEGQYSQEELAGVADS